ncbi:MAG: tRNA dihydrouridine(20/20a) synthase DusA [Hyphomicrobium sp.]
MTYAAHKFCIAPMMDWTDRHCRAFHRIISQKARLYSEMVSTNALLHGNKSQILAFSPLEHPVALQLGGGNPKELALCAKIGEEAGYDEINLNVGCPSDRVQDGRIGACLMAEPYLVSECLAAMRASVSIPVSIKCRIGIDAQDTESDFQNFVETVAQSGCKIFIIHARKAFLKGLSPKENRDIPPLDYERVYRLKQSRPDLIVILNGGIISLEECEEHLKFVDGVMMGRAAYKYPYMLSEVDRLIFKGKDPQLSRREIIENLIPYIENHLNNNGRLNNILKHTLGLFHECRGARLYRKVISEEGILSTAGIEVLYKALKAVGEEISSSNTNSSLERQNALCC